MTAPLLISACLIGAPVRYDGRAKTLSDTRIETWHRQGHLLPLCPEIIGGLPTPRPAAEIETGFTADDVLAGRARILDASGTDHTKAFVEGAQQVLAMAHEAGCTLALLTDASPTCGSTRVYDGQHRGARIAGVGILTALLRANGIRVFAPHQLDALESVLST